MPDKLDIPAVADIFDGEVASLRGSEGIVGPLYEVLVDANDIPIDGNHRLKAKGDWPIKRLPKVVSRFQRSIVRCHANFNRRPITDTEIRKELKELQEAAIQDPKIKRRLTSAEIGERLGKSEQWVRKYMPPEMSAHPEKAKFGLNNPSVRKVDPRIGKDTGMEIKCPEPDCGETFVLIHHSSGHKLKPMTMISNDPHMETSLQEGELLVKIPPS